MTRRSNCRLKTWGGAPLADPVHLRFTGRRRRLFWKGNCVAIGLSAGFLEPLEAASTSLIHAAIPWFIQLVSNRSDSPAQAGSFNIRLGKSYDKRWIS